LGATLHLTLGGQRTQSRNAWALYGRGLAETRKQKISAAEDDFAAATALSPHIADEFKTGGQHIEGALAGI
jgi:hypothetical protein